MKISSADRPAQLIIGLTTAFFAWIAPTLACADQTIELIRDARFQRGFWCLEPRHPSEGGRIFREGKLQLADENGEPAWELVQWYSRGSIAQLSPVPSQFGGRVWKSELKTVVLNPPRADEGELTLAVNSIKEFQGMMRKDESPWPHLLIQQSFIDPTIRSPSNQIRVSHIKEAKFRVDLRLDLAEHQAPASQFVMYFTVANVDSKSSGHGDMMWFGILFYDDRYAVPGPYLIDGDRDHAKFIYNTGISPFVADGLKLGEWKIIQVDLAKFLQDAFEQAWKRGYLAQSRDLQDYSLTGMNLGWEVPGLANVSMRMKNLSLELVLP